MFFDAFEMRHSAKWWLLFVRHYESNLTEIKVAFYRCCTGSEAHNYSINYCIQFDDVSINMMNL